MTPAAQQTENDHRAKTKNRMRQTTVERSWMWVQNDIGEAEGSIASLAWFRTTFEGAPACAANEASMVISIAADSRYRLFVNGTLAANGPARPSAAEYFEDTLDVTRLVRDGKNVLGLEVLAYPQDVDGNISVLRTGQPGVSVVGTAPDGTDLADLGQWKAAAATGRQFRRGEYTQFLGIQETVEGSREPHGWSHPTFDDGHWPTAISAPRFSGSPLLALVPRRQPPPTLTATSWQSISSRRGDDPGWSNLLHGRSVTIPAHTDISVDLDIGSLTTAYLEVQFSAGAGSQTLLTAAECYEAPPIEIPWLRRKTNRTDASRGDLYGDPDSYTVAGSGTPAAPETYSPFWFRTLRYLRIEVSTRHEPLVLQGIAVTSTNYPLHITGSFRSSHIEDSLLWETSVRTLRNCMHETFEDCPYYEQLQYALDTRSQSLYNLYLSTDDRLVRRAIEDLAASGDPHGLTESRAPSHKPQVIPGFSLYWILMVGEHLDHVGDLDFTHRQLARVEAVLGHFDSLVDHDGLIVCPPDTAENEGPSTIWHFVDWTETWRQTRGAPDLGNRRANTILTLQYLTALRAAAAMATACSEPAAASKYRSQAEDVARRLATSAIWDPVTRFFRDSDFGAPGSQHAQVWAVLAGVITGGAANDLLARAVTDPRLAPCSYATALSLFDALRIVGLHDHIDWSPWHHMLELGLTTWAEDTVSERSDCHAWGSVPLQHFPRWVLGVRPAAPGYAAVAVEPSPSDRRYAEGVVPTPHGPITVRWDQVVPDTIHVRVRLPTSIELLVPPLSRDFERTTTEDEQVIRFTYLPGGADRREHPLKGAV